MRIIINFLSGLCGLYSLLILIRILLTWFSGSGYGRPVYLLSRITDPYLNWWRRIPGLRIGYVDISPIAAMAALSIMQTILSTIAHYGSISLGIIIAIILSALWSAVSFLLGFCVIILILRFIAYMMNRNTMSGFWNIIDSISRPILYRVNRIIFGKRMVTFMTSIVVSTVIMALIWVGLKFIMNIILAILVKTPV
ncbi:MAG: YggT family protein [Treponema sp.]|nr:YggT family protein [Treponema sp.]